MSNNSTCKKCTNSNFRQIGELSHDEWLRRVNGQGWKGGRAGWIHAQSLVTMSHNAMMEFFKVGDTPPPF